MPISKADIEKIFEDIKANLAMLDKCEGPHEFVEFDDGGVAHFRCGKCGGKVRRESCYWYQRGLEHGQQLTEGANDVE